MGVGGQRHAPAALPPGKTRYPLYRRLSGPQGRSRQVWKSTPPTGIRSPDPTALTRLIVRVTAFIIAGAEEGNTKCSSLKVVCVCVCVCVCACVRARAHTHTIMRKCHREFRQKRKSVPAESWWTFVGYCVPQLIAVCVLYTEIRISILFE